MIVSIRGTNGSGKSTLVRTLLSRYKNKATYGVLGPRRPEAYELRVPGLKKPLYILGSYHVASGGCDQIQPYDLILDLLAKYSAKGHILFEGVLVSATYGRIGRYLEDFGQQAVMAFLDTTLEQCIENVRKRRDVKFDARVLNPNNLTRKFNEINKIAGKVREEGKIRAETISMKHGPEQVLDILWGAE